MGLSRRRFTLELKLAAIQRLEQGISIAEVTRAMEVNPNVLHRPRKEFRQWPGNAFPGQGQRRWSEGRMAELERKIGQQTLKIDFWKGCLQRIEEQRMLQASNGNPPLRQGPGSDERPQWTEDQRMLELGRMNRSSFYRYGPERKPTADRDMELRDAIQRIALEWPCYGRPRITEELRRQGWTVNPKRVYRLMREDNLLCVRRRKFLVTTDSNHSRRIYPHLARALVLTDVNQLWIADLTYIRLLEELVFLAAILDAFSRRVIGWALDRNLDDDLTLAALRMAIACRSPLPGLVHHSDRGSQYASGDYIALLEANHIRISMSRKRNPWENAACESFMKTLKYEEVYRNEYRDLAEARASIGEFLEKVYNQKRLHSSLGYVPPAEFEARRTAQTMEAASRQLSLGVFEA
jgi:putative transposase